MPAPTNTSFLTATDLGTLPATVAQQVDDAGTTYTVYYKFTAPSTGVAGAFGFGDLTVYRPTIYPFAGPAASPTSVLSIAAENKPIQFQVTAGTLYLLRLTTNAGNPTPANLTLNVQMFAEQATPAGSIVIPDDVSGFPAAIISPTTGDVIKFVHPFPAGEWGEVFDNTKFLVEDIADGSLTFYDGTFVEQSNFFPFGVAAFDNPMRLSPDLRTIYVGTSNLSGAAKITTVSSSGVLGGTTWTLPAAGLTAIAPNNDGSKVYVSGQTSSVNTPIKTWIPASSTFGSDLYPAQGANTKIVDMVALADDTIIAAWLNTSTQAVDVRHISAAGTLLATYSTTSADTPIPKLAHDSVGRQSFVWLWTHAANGVSTFHTIATSTMTATTVTGMEFEGGAYQGAATATPTDRFGFSYSCPFFLLRSLPTIDTSEPCCPCDCSEPIGPSGSPSSAPISQFSHTGAILPPTSLSVLAWTPACTGGGDVPTAADATDAESWIS